MYLEYGLVCWRVQSLAGCLEWNLGADWGYQKDFHLALGWAKSLEVH